MGHNSKFMICVDYKAAIIYPIQFLIIIGNKARYRTIISDLLTIWVFQMEIGYVALRPQNSRASAVVFVLPVSVLRRKHGCHSW